MIDISYTKDDNAPPNDGKQIPSDVIDAFARCLIPSIQTYYEMLEQKKLPEQHSQ